MKAWQFHSLRSGIKTAVSLILSFNRCSIQSDSAIEMRVVSFYDDAVYFLVFHGQKDVHAFLYFATAERASVASAYTKHIISIAITDHM